jgi:hypothetical protein
MESEPTPHHPAFLSTAVALVAVATAVGFHFLFYGRQYGVAFALFMMILFAGVQVLGIMTGKKGNPWAYLFVVPLVLALAAEVLYASNVVRGAGFMIAVASLTFFTYWVTSPRVRFWDARSLWPVSLFTESILPFGRFGAFVNELIKGKRHFSRVLTGVVIAIPLLLVIGALFISADAFVQKTMSAYVNAANMGRVVMRALWDAFAFVFFASAGWTLVTRLLESRRPSHHQSELNVDHVIASTVLILLNVLFAVFLGFQAVYFFGGESFIQSQGIAYAQYAREGFFQLLWVAIIVTGVIAAVYRVAGMRFRLVRGASILLALETSVIIVSAIRRMTLYIDAYGLSVLRFWATVGIYAIAAVLLFGVIAIIGRVEFEKLVKVMSVGILALAAASLLVNVEGIVADYNVNAYLAGRTNQMDAKYLTDLSSDAVPALVRLAQAHPDLQIGDPKDVRVAEAFQAELNDPTSTEMTRGTVSEALKQTNARLRPLATILRERESFLRYESGADWRNLVFSDYAALASLGSLK